MPVPSLYVAVLDRIKEAGDEYTLKGKLACESYEVGSEVYSLSDGIEYDLVFTNTGGAVLLAGIARAQATGQCARCLEPASFDIASEVEGFYIIEGSCECCDADGEPIGADEFEHISPDGEIDIAPALNAALVLETPTMPLCREDCLGLCPVCGENLNVRDCGHASAAAEASMTDEDNPFSVLKGLDFSN